MVAFFTVVLLFWEYFAQSLIRDLFVIPNYYVRILLPTPTQIVNAFLGNLARWPINTWVTIQEIIVGFIAGSLIGLFLGILIAYSRIAEKIVYPMAIFIRSAPLVALAPILTLWFGRGLESKVAIVVLIAFFPVVINTALGMKSVDVSLLDLLKSLSAKERQTFQKVKLPSAIPSIFAGLKVAMSTSVTAAIVGEFVGASDLGLGNMAMIALQFSQTDRIFAILGILALLGLSLFGLISLIEKIISPWYKST
jgi:NitT/TauT family transport system permease protein